MTSPYASYFDIDWDLDPDGRIVLPVLGSDDDVDGSRWTATCCGSATGVSHRAGHRSGTGARCTTASTTG